MGRVCAQTFRTSDRRVVPWLLVGLLVLFGGVYVTGYLLTSDRVPRGTTVSGVEIGGMRPAAAKQKLADELEERAAEPVMVTAFSQRGRVDPGEAGMEVDVDASVEQAGGGRSWHPGRIWSSLTGGEDLEAVVTVDEDALAEELKGFTREVDTRAREGRVVFKGDSAVARQPRDGEVVDLDRAVDAVQDAFLAEETAPVELPTETDEPEIDKDDVSRAMDEFANPAVSGPVVVELEGERIELRPRDYTSALSMVAEDGELVPRLDEKRLIRGLRPRMRTSALAPRDATVRLVDGRPQVVPAKRGVTFDPDDITDSFLDVVVAEGAERSLTVDGVVARPDFTTAEARALGIKEEVSEFTTYFPHSDYRNTNLGRAAELINGTVLKPGDVFSMNETVGERTAANGFTKGFIISDGVYREELGGGVSQVATTTFNAMFFAGLKAIEHKPHSFYIDRYPVGREATLAWPYVDLRFQNDTPHGVLIQAWIDPSTPSSSGAMHVRMWSTKYWRIVAGKSERYNFTEPKTRRLSGPECVPNEGYGGFDIDVYRTFYRVGSRTVDHRETFSTTYLPSDTVICED